MNKTCVTPNVLVVDGDTVPNPEDLAMLQALYSRSSESVARHLETVRAGDSGGFVKKFYVGYGHKSIADCGTTTLFLENVSTLAAKAVQDWPLYCGQETSTRYIDMGRQPIVDPVGSPESAAILDRWMDFYRGSQEAVSAHIREQYPRKEGEKESVYDRAVSARTFDIMRGFLPAGICTQLSWHTNLRQAGDHLTGLIRHPTAEIRGLAEKMEKCLAERYRNSGFESARAGVSGVGQKEGAAARAKWDDYAASYTYPDHLLGLSASSTRQNRSTIDVEALQRYQTLLNGRPKGSVLPHFLSDLGQLTFSFLLDFGSFRDIQRHRNGVCRMPLLTTHFGFGSWYLDQLPDDLAANAIALISVQREAIEKLPCDKFEKQYYVGLGFKMPCRLTYGLPATVYVMELRSSRRVHPTVRDIVLNNMVPFFRKSVPGVPIYIDEEPSDWDVRRGLATITEK